MVNMEQAVALERPVRDLARWEIRPLSRSTGDRQLANRIGQQTTKRRRPLWRLPRSVITFAVGVAVWIGFAFFAGFAGSLLQ